MRLDDWIGALGVSLLLIAFALNLLGRLDRGSRTYQALNALGAAILGIVAWRIGFMPLVVLEIVWFAVSALAFFHILKPKA